MKKEVSMPKAFQSFFIFMRDDFIFTHTDTFFLIHLDGVK